VLETHGALLKDTVVSNIEAGRLITGPQIAQVERQRTDLHHRLLGFLDEYEFLMLPVSQVPPFDVEQPYVTEIGGVAMESYIDWMRSCYYISVTGLPAISVPAGFTDDGLPVGLQIVGRHRDDVGVLQMAHAFEQATGFWERHPPLST
jgi:amidase